MTNVILQPAGANSENHFRDSIEKPIPLDPKGLTVYCCLPTTKKNNLSFIT